MIPHLYIKINKYFIETRGYFLQLKFCENLKFLKEQNELLTL